MKHRFEKRILSLILCITMVLTIVITNANFAFSATYSDGAIGGSEYSEELENNIGKQAIFDWWDNFFIVDDPKREDIADIYMYTDVNSTYDDGENYWYLYEEKFYYDGTSTGQPFIDAYDVKMIITDYYYDNINGYHWYKVTGADLPEPLVEKPWILYALDADSEYGFDPTLCIYEIDETIRFVTTELKDYAIDGDGNYVLDENGNYIEEGLPLLNFYVFAGPMEIANAEISITSRNEDYPVSELSCMENTYGTIFSKAFDFTIDKAIGEEVDLWTPEDGMISIRYQSTMLPADTYKQDCYCGSAFMYVDDKLFCATSTERSIEISDLTYTNSGSSVLVIELLDETFFREMQPAYFANDSVTLYDNNMQAAEFLAAQLPVTFTAECSFWYNKVQYYWLENKGFIGSPYFIAKADDVILDELPEEFGDGRVSITDKMGNSVSEIVLPQYEKPEFSAISSLSKTTADVKYQWQICYDVDNYLWVDIYGENNANIKISYGMVKTLLDENGQCAIRCESKTSTKTAYSNPIVITLEMYEPKEPDVVVSESFVTSNGETVTVSVAGDIPEDASVKLEETDSSGVDVNAGETVVASLDISIKNADGTEWQPESGETVKVELPATAVGLKNGDRFVVYHLHQGEVKVLGTYMVTNGTVAFDVDGFSKFVFALAVDTSNVDYAANVEGEAFFNPALYDESINTYNNVNITDKPENGLNFSTDYVFNPQNHMDLRMIIEDYCLNGTGYWYKVKAADGYTLPAELEAKPWIYQNDIPTSNYANNLLIIPPAPKAPDFSGDLDKHAHFTYSADLYIEVSDVEPYAGVESMSYSRDQFSTDFTVMIDDYKVITVSSDIVDKNTGVVIGRSYVQSLWYKVNVVSGTCTDDFRDGFWVLQNYLTEGDEYPVDTLTLFDAPVVPDEPEEPYVHIYNENGEIVSYIEMLASEKPSITAKTSLTGSVKYQWQLCYDVDNEYWMDIYGQTSETLILSYALLAGVLEEGMTAVRCVTFNAVETVESYPIVVSVLGSYVEKAYWFYNVYGRMMYASTPDSAADGITAVAETPSTVLVTVQFVMGDSSVPIENGIFTYNIPYNGNVSQSLVIPEVQGYAAYYEDNRTTVYSGQYQLNETGVTENKTITFRFWPAKVSYKVVYQLQNATDDGYTTIVTEDLTGLTGSDPVINSDPFKNYPKIDKNGIVLVWKSTDKIASDGKTVIEIKYDRLYFKMLFDHDGGYGVQPVYARYETPVSVVNPTKAGYSFMGWNALNGHYNTSDDANTVDIETFADIEIPAMHTNYKALWLATDDAKVTVVIWGQKADNSDDLTDHNSYDYMAKTEDNTDLTELHFYAKPGTSVTYNPNGGYVCGYSEQHTHGQGDCMTSCGEIEHITHDNSCYTCGIVSHTHSMNCYTMTGGSIGTKITSTNTIRDLEDGTPDSNGVVSRFSLFGGTRYYFKIQETWYQIDNYNRSNFSYTLSCGEDEVVHDHTEYCVGASSNCPGLHSHDATCYSGCTKEEHTHGADCSLDVPMESSLWEFDHSGEVIVAADGTSTLNVYYRRKQFTLTFNYNYSNGSYKKQEKITARWGENIHNEYTTITTDAGGTFWSEKNTPNSYSNTYTNYIGIMPKRSVTYYNWGVSGNTGSMTYFGQDQNGAYTVKLFEVPDVGGFNITDEDKYEFNGFKFSHFDATRDGSGYNCEGAVFYYTRNDYNLVFDNYGEKEDSKSVLFEAPLASYGSFKLDDSKAPAYYQPGSVTFKGWYAAPQTPGDFNFKNVQPFDFANTTMPASDLIVYAWWEPVSHNVTFYYDYPALESDTIYTVDGEEKKFSVPHGSKIQYPYTPPKDPTSNYYSFVGWTYRDKNGNEILWDFENSTVTEDIKLYGKWNSTTAAEYTVKFVTIKDGVEVEIADRITGKALGGTSKTFDAKFNEDLYEVYQDRYYPRDMSHMITIDIANPDNNTFTFYYDYVEFTSYTVKYLEAGTNKPMSEINSSYPSQKTVDKNTHAMVTETFVAIPGYLPDAYQKVCKIVPKGTNEIIFYYTKDDVNGLYTVHFWLQGLDGNYVEDVSMQITATAANGSTITAPTNTVIPNYTFKEANPDTVKINKEVISHIHMYYDRTVHDYRVQYLEAGTNKVLATEKVVEDLMWGTLITENAIDIKNYDVYGDSSKSIEILVDETKNVIKFYYIEELVKVNYAVVGPDGTVDRDGDADFGKVTPNFEKLAIINGKASGSVATPSSSVYKFVGWYSDKDCTVEVGKDATFVPTKDADKLWINGTTYYAKFEYNLTSLTIDKNFPKNADYSMDENQSFLFDVVEVDASGKVVEGGAQLRVTIHGDGQITIDGLTVGHYYKIIEKTDWSWRYGTCTPSSEIDTEVSADGWIIVQLTADASINKVTFENERTKDQWLDGDSWCNNLFK